MQAEPEFVDKCVEGLVLAFFNQGEVCTCPSRALVQEDMYEAFMQKVVERTKAIKRGNPLDTDVQVGAQASKEQFDKILSYLEIGKQEGAELLTGGGREDLGVEFNDGFYIQPTLFKGDNKMRVFQEEIFGPVVGVTTFKTEEEALAIANDTEFGLGAGVWTRDTNLAYRMGRAIQAGRVWMNCYHAYPAHAAFGGYKKSGVGRETHKMALEHYQQTKNLLVSYDTNRWVFSNQQAVSCGPGLACGWSPITQVSDLFWPLPGAFFVPQAEASVARIWACCCCLSCCFPLTMLSTH